MRAGQILRHAHHELDLVVFHAAQDDHARAHFLLDGVDQALELVLAGVLDCFGQDLHALDVPSVRRKLARRLIGVLLLSPLHLASQRIHFLEDRIQTAFDLLGGAGADALRERLEQVQPLLEVGQRSMSGVRHDAALA